MKTYSLTHRHLVLDRIGVAWAFFCCGSVFGLLLSTWLLSTFLSERSNYWYVLAAVMFGLIYPVTLLLAKLLRRTASPSGGGVS